MRAAAKEVSINGLVDTKRTPRVGKRRNWPEAFKRQVVDETLEPGSSVSIAGAPARPEHERAVQMAAGDAAEGAARLADGSNERGLSTSSSVAVRGCASAARSHRR